MASEVDRTEAEAAAQEAVRRVLSGQGGVMVTLIADRSKTYRCTTGVVPLERVANVEKPVPPEFLSDQRPDVTDAFLDYARPLIGGDLPGYQHVRSLHEPR